MLIKGICLYNMTRRWHCCVLFVKIRQKRGTSPTLIILYHFILAIWGTNNLQHSWYHFTEHQIIQSQLEVHTQSTTTKPILFLYFFLIKIVVKLQFCSVITLIKSSVALRTRYRSIPPRYSRFFQVCIAEFTKLYCLKL